WRAGTWILLDRFVDSSLAYQGAGRELGIAAIAEINRFATASLRPDRTLLLWLAPSMALARSRARAEPTDRLEAEAAAFFERVAAAYDALACAEPARIRRLDAAAAPQGVPAPAL